jgi:spore coat polysaccharide biosynthesis protein SpsF
MTGLFLQVRLDSSRLPGKALLPLAGKPMVSHAMEALKKVDADIHALVTDEGSRERLLPLAEDALFEVFVGSKLDVLRRYCDAARHYGVQTIIRATGDNPLVSRDLAEKLLEEHRKFDSDYSGYFGMPLGTGVEIIRAAALLRAERETREPYDREHVTPYLYRNPQEFYLHRPLADRQFRSRFRVTVDTKEDYKLVTRIFREIYRGGPPGMEALMLWIRENSPEAGER